jgi:hypothetical protein
MLLNEKYILDIHLINPPLTGIKTLLSWNDKGRSIQCHLMPRHVWLATIESRSVCRFDFLFRCNLVRHFTPTVVLLVQHECPCLFP